MRCGFLAVLSCLALLSAGCGYDAANRGANNSGPRTTNKPVIEDRTGQPTGTTPAPGSSADRNLPAGQSGATDTSGATNAKSGTAPAPSATQPSAAPSETVPSAISGTGTTTGTNAGANPGASAAPTTTEPATPSGTP